MKPEQAVVGSATTGPCGYFWVQSAVGPPCDRARWERIGASRAPDEAGARAERRQRPRPVDAGTTWRCRHPGGRRGGWSARTRIGMLYPVQRLPREALPMSAEITDELAAAIGWVAIEAATLEYFLAQVVATAWDWDEGTFRKALSKTAWLQDQFRRLAEEKQDPALLDIARAAEARLRDRHVVMHSVATAVSYTHLRAPETVL